MMAKKLLDPILSYLGLMRASVCEARIAEVRVPDAELTRQWEVNVLNTATYLRRYTTRELHRQFQEDNERYKRVYPIPSLWGTVVFGLLLLEMSRRGMLQVCDNPRRRTKLRRKP